MKLPSDDICGANQKLDPVLQCIQPADRVVDYSEYMWMGEEMEEFDRMCIAEMLEEEFIENCIEEMMEEEDEIYEFIDWFVEEHEGVDPQLVIQYLQDFALSNNVELTFLQDPTSKRHKLNPNAPEFIPSKTNVQLVTSPSPEVPNDR